MAFPNVVLSTLRPDLVGSLEQYDLDGARQGFIATRVATPIDVALKSDVVSIWAIDQLIKNANVIRSPGTPYARIDAKFGTFTYSCKDNGVEEAIDDGQAMQYANYFDAELMATKRVRDTVLREMEKRVAALIFNSGTWTGAAYAVAAGAQSAPAAATAWSVFATADPKGDVLWARKKIFANCGLVANTVIMSWATAENLRNCLRIIDLVKYWGGDDPKMVTNRALAMALGVEQVLISGQSKNAANEGQAMSLSNIWADNMVHVCFVDPSNDHTRPCVARTMHYTADGSTIGSTIEGYRQESVRGNVVRARMDTDEIVVMKDAGFLITGV